MYSESHAVDVPNTWRELSTLSMKELRCLARALDSTLGGSHSCSVRNWRSQRQAQWRATPLHKPSIPPPPPPPPPPEVMPFYLEVGDLAGVWSRVKNWTTDLRGAPSAFGRDLLEGYLQPGQGIWRRKPEKFSVIACISIVQRKTRPQHSVLPTVARKDEAATEERSALQFVSCPASALPPKTRPLKQPYPVIVCLDRRTGVPYGAHSVFAAASPAWENHEAILWVFFLHLRLLLQESITPCRMAKARRTGCVLGAHKVS